MAHFEGSSNRAAAAGRCHSSKKVTKPCSIPENDLLLIAEYAVGLGSMRSACLVEYKADDGPELATGHADEKSQRRDQQVGTRRAESERQATYAAFGPIGPEAFVDILSGVQ